MTTTVHDNPTGTRYDIYLADELAGFTTYKITGNQIAFNHTETFPAFAGKGLAKVLVAGALDDVRRRGLAVLPFCPYVRKFISQNTTKYLDLVPDNQRERFNLALPAAPQPDPLGVVHDQGES